MQIFLENVLDVQSLQIMNEMLDDESLLVDGRTTAGRTAAEVKNNLQAQRSSVVVKEAVSVVEKALLAHPVFVAAAQPKHLARTLFSVYRSGMSYGTHTDDPFIAGIRADLSFTLFLSDPDSYEGGELVLQKHEGDEEIKLAAGCLALYPTGTLHRVEEVTRGERRAVIGWVQSRFRSGEQRETLFDVQNVLGNLPDIEVNQEARLSLLKVQSRLFRMWAD